MRVLDGSLLFMQIKLKCECRMKLNMCAARHGVQVNRSVDGFCRVFKGFVGTFLCALYTTLNAINGFIRQELYYSFCLMAKYCCYFFVANELDAV